VTLPGVTRSEWTKLWSLRSTRWSLLLAFLAQAGLGPLFALLTMAHWNQQTRFEDNFNPINRSLRGWVLAQLAIAVLGVMTISGEYTTGQIKSSLMAVPKRLPVLWSKLIVFASVAFVLMIVAALIGFVASQAIFTQHHVNVALSSPHALRAVVGTALLSTVTGAFCVGLATIVRRTAGGITLFVALFFVLPGISGLLPTSTDNAINPYLPTTIGSSMTDAFPGSYAFSAWGSFALLCGYAVLAIVIAAVALLRRDA
jgi:ABC-type transport system involved in multi-copper enzyme maturation permease subunit